MKIRFRSVFDEQSRRHRSTWFFVILGVVWMAVLGCLTVAAHLALFAAVDKSAVIRYEDARWWCAVAAGIAVGIWGFVALLLLWSSQRILPRLVGARPATGNNAQVLTNVCEEMAIASGVPRAPRWYVIDDSALNAFAVGRSERGGAIVVTRGLLTSLDRDELQAVVAHELAHLKNGDAQFLVQAVAFAWMVVGVGIVAVSIAVLLACMVVGLTWLLWKVAEGVGESGSEHGPLVGCALMLGSLAVLVYGLALVAAYALMVALVLVLVAIGVKAASSAISQSREYLADSCAAQWTRNPLALASALAKVTGAAQLEGIKGAVVAPLWLEDTGGHEGGKIVQRLFAFLLHTHPPIERRLETLKEITGTPVVTDARWLATIHSGPWQRFKEWAFPALATGLAAGITITLLFGMENVWLTSGPRRGESTPGSHRADMRVVASAQTSTKKAARALEAFSLPPATGPERARTETPQSLPPEVVKPATEPKPETPSALPAGPLNAEVSEKIRGVVLAQLQKMVEGPSTLPKAIHEGAALEEALDGQTYQATVYKGFNIYTDPKGNILPKMLKFYIRTSNAWKVSEQTIIPAGTHIRYEYALGKCEVISPPKPSERNVSK